MSVDYPWILDDLRRRIPANLVIAPTILLTQAASKLFVGSAVRLSVKQSMTVFADGGDGMTAFTDESGAILTDERGKNLVCGGNTMTPNLTSKGHVLLLRALDGEALKFTRIQLGNGAQNAKSATALSNPLVTLPLTKMVTGSQYITLTSSFFQ